MASSATASGAEHTDDLSAAQKLLQKHAVTVEEVPDEEDLKHPKPSAPEPEPAGKENAPSWGPTMSTKAAGKQKVQESTGGRPTALDTQSHELFPELGGPKPKASAGVVPQWGAKTNVNGKTNGTSPANGTSRASTPASGIATPTSSAFHGPPAMSIPGRNVESIWLEPQHILPRTQLRRPIPDIIKDLNRKSRATISMPATADRRLRFDAAGPQDIAQQALKELVQQIGAKQSVTVPIPQSARAHIIGKQGSTIKALQEKTGARIQLPKVENNDAPVDEDDDSTIDVVVEGNAISAAAARDAILKIAGERAANVNTKLRGIPAEFYPFLAGAKSNLRSNLEQNGVQVRIPPHQVFSSQPPARPEAGQRPVFQPASVENPIQLAGDRAAVQAARAQIERQVEELRQQLAVETMDLQRGRHQFIIGDHGMPMEDFFESTGCAIVLPTEDDDTITVIGPADQVQAAVDKALELAQSVHCDNFRLNKQIHGADAAHVANVARYLRQRKEIERLEKAYGTLINTPSEGNVPQWEIYARDLRQINPTRAEIKGLFESHPPSRMSTVPVDPFFHQYLRNEVNSRVHEDYGVHLVVPEASESGAPVLLVYEAPGPYEQSYQIPRNQPSQNELRSFQDGLRAAQKHILDLISQQDEITTATVDVPQKFHERLRRFIKKEQESRPSNQIPIRVSSLGTTITLRGPATAVQNLAEKITAFVEQEKEDEKERGFILSFDFPQKFANHLIGKGGSNIRELRDKFDVDIQVHDGKVDLKGPKAKAEAAKTHILALGKQLADEATHILKIEPKFHRELIGAQGAQINRLQTRYKVLIFFPRSEKNAKDDESTTDAASVAGKPRRQQAPDEVIIRGPKKGADEARDEILTLYQYLKDNSFTATITVQQKQLPSLIGQGGSAMEALRQQTGAKIDIPNGREATDSLVEIQIKGTKPQVAAAKKILEEKKSVFDDTVIRTLEVDKKYHKALIGSGGANIRDIVVKAGGSDDRRELARTVQFPKQEAEGNAIKVEGRKDIVDKICAQIQEIVSQRESQVTSTVEVPVEKHRSLIGRGGDAKRQLESQFNVSIDIPRQGSGQTGVKITGQSTDVEKAKEHILSSIKEQQGETIQVPRSLHHAVSNNGQIFRKLRNDHHVTVDHAGQATPPKPSPAQTRANGGALPLITDDEEATADAHSWKVVENTSAEEGDIPWVLRGSPENIEKAKKAIETALEQAKKGNVTGYLVLPDPRTYRHVIGQGGSKVNSIRKQSGCKINVPRDQAKDEAIEVIGSKEGVEKAKDLILAAVRDGVNGKPARE